MITIGIIAVTVLVSLIAFSNVQVFDRLCFSPALMVGRPNEYFRFISVGFVHADFGHLLFNMLTLWFFGSVLENQVFSPLQYVFFYFSALVLSSIPEYQKQKNNEAYRACGASGAVSAVLFALVLYRPWGVIYIKFIIPLYFILFAVFYLGYSWYRSRHQTDDNIGHGTHFWGALYGIAFTLLTHPESLSMFIHSIQHPPFL